MNKKTVNLISILIFAFLWQIFAVLAKTPLVFPTFTATVFKLFELCATQEFWQSTLFSSLRVFAGFFISVFLGIIAGVLSGIFPLFKAFIAFPLSLIRSVPAVSFILLAVFVFNSDFVPVFSAVLMAFPVMTAAVSSGLDFSEDDKKLFFMAKVFKLTKSQKIRFIVLPKLQNFVESGIFSTFGMSWKVVAAAEVLSIPKKALGAILQNAQVQLESSTLLATTIMLVFLSFAFEKILHKAFDRLFLTLTSPDFSKKVQKNKKTKSFQKKSCEKLKSEQNSDSVKIQNLTIKKGNKLLFENFNYEFKKNKITAILAPSGSGKTTLLTQIALTNQEVSFLFQEPRLLPSLTVFQNVFLPLFNIYKAKKAEEIAEKYLKATGLFERKDEKTQNLSGGEKQRIAMARSFAFPSKILLLDEAFQSLDEKIKKSLGQTLKKLLSESPKTVIFVTHEKSEAKEIADITVEMEGEPLKISSSFS